MSDGDRLARQAQVAQQFLRGLRIGLLVIAGTVLLSFSMLRHLPVYEPLWPQLLAFGVLVGIATIEAVLVARRRPWGRTRWIALAATVGAYLASCASLPAGHAATAEDWAFGTVGWIALILLLNRPFAEFVLFLAAHEAITVVSLVLGNGDQAAFLNLAAGSIGPLGYPFATGIAAMALRTVARTAEAASFEAERARTKDAVDTELDRQRQQRFADLDRTTIPLLSGLADGTLDPRDDHVRRDCRIEAARMRRLFAEVDEVPNQLLHELRACAADAEGRGIEVDVVAQGSWSDPPDEIRRALTEVPLVVFATATSKARVAVVGTAELLSVSVVADSGPIELPHTGGGPIGLKAILDENVLWVEATWMIDQ